LVERIVSFSFADGPGRNVIHDHVYIQRIVFYLNLYKIFWFTKPELRKCIL